LLDEELGLKQNVFEDAEAGYLTRDLEFNGLSEDTYFSVFWDEPWSSVSGPGKEATTNIVVAAFSEDFQYIFRSDWTFCGGRDDDEPIEFGDDGDASIDIQVADIALCWGFLPDKLIFEVFIGPGSGSDLPSVLWITWGDSFDVKSNPSTRSGSVLGHIYAKNAIAVAAADYLTTPINGVDPAEMMSFTSTGGSPVFFDKMGDRFEKPEYRKAPWVMGSNGDWTSLAPDSGLNPFYGTSAAAPNVAAVAALVLEAASDYKMTHDQLKQILKNSADDTDDLSIGGFDIGYDITTGYGFLDARRAVYLASIGDTGEGTCDSGLVKKGGKKGKKYVGN